MEAVRTNRGVKMLGHIKFWHWLGRIAPMMALLALCLSIWLDPEHWTEYVIITIAVAFGSIAFAWWWWVVFAVKNLTEMLSKSRDDFEKVVIEIGSLKEELQKGRRARIIERDNVIPFEKDLNHPKDD